MLSDGKAPTFSEGSVVCYNAPMESSVNKVDPDRKPKGPRTRRILAVVFAILCVVFLLVAFWVKRNVYASKFTPVVLSQKEEEVLGTKLAMLQESNPFPGKEDRLQPGRPLDPEPYSEEGANREISLTERELNGLIANTPDVAERVAVDLSDDLVSVKLVVPVDDEVPVLGGKTLKVHMGLAIRYEGGKPNIALKGVSLGGIPLPNAWLGHLKNVNLLEEFGTGDGFWKIFSEGVRGIKVRQGHLRILLKE